MSSRTSAGKRKGRGNGDVGRVDRKICACNGAVPYWFLPFKICPATEKKLPFTKFVHEAITTIYSATGYVRQEAKTYLKGLCRVGIEKTSCLSIGLNPQDETQNPVICNGCNFFSLTSSSLTLENTQKPRDHVDTVASAHGILQIAPRRARCMQGIECSHWTPLMR